MWNFSSTAVPPEVNSRSSVALFMLVLSVSQWPTSDFSFSNASAPAPAAGFGTGIIPIVRKSTLRTFAKPLIDRSPFKLRLNRFRNSTTRNKYSSHCDCRLLCTSKPLRRKSHNCPEQHSWEQNVPEQSHSRPQNHQKAEDRGNPDACQNPQRHGVDSLRNISSGHSRQQSFQQRKRDHTSHNRGEGGLEKSAQAVKKPENSSHGESQHRFCEAHRFLLRKGRRIRQAPTWHSCRPASRRKGFPRCL